MVFVVALAGAVFGWPLAWALMALQLLVGLTFGRRFCLPCLAYFELIQPRIGEGRLEDSRPPRLANQMGFVFLTAASVTLVARRRDARDRPRRRSSPRWRCSPRRPGSAPAASSTSSAPACAASRPATTTGSRSADLDGFPAADRNIVQFTHPICSDCREWDARLAAAGTPRVTIDVRESPGLAEKYGIAVVPTIFAVDREGAVIERLA